MDEQELADSGSKIDKLWATDLFDRRKEAANLQAYIESIWQTPNSSEASKVKEDTQGFVLAIDADYGMGKTFFLKRLQAQLELNHPVAYIDAWKDDLHDEPFIALLATLEDALTPHFKKNPIIKTKFNEVLKKGKKIGGLMAAGLFLRVLGAIFTPKIVDLISESFVEIDAKEDVDHIEKVMGEAEKSALSSVPNVTAIIKEEGDLKKKISAFRESQASIDELKKSLRALVGELKSLNGDFPPIIIIIDELDRCRPTYAIKLLEEIKHLFDVEGLFFILGINLSQLGKSVSKVYGANFASVNYLSRFYSRKYKLIDPKPQTMIREFIQIYGVKENMFIFHRIKLESNPNSGFEANLVGFLTYYEISPRDYFKIFRILQTCIAVAAREILFLPQILRLIISDIIGVSEFNRRTKENFSKVTFIISDEYGAPAQEVDGARYLALIDEILQSPTEKRNKWSTNGDLELAALWERIAYVYYINGSLAAIPKYPELINWVQRIE